MGPGSELAFQELGVYSLVAGEDAHGWPMWKHATLDRYIARALSGNWEVRSHDGADPQALRRRLRLPARADLPSSLVLPHESTESWNFHDDDGDASFDDGLKVIAPPATLVLTGQGTFMPPGGHAASSYGIYPSLGVYSLVAGQEKNGRPVWKNVDEDRFALSGGRYIARLSSGDWAVQDGDDVSQGDRWRFRLPGSPASAGLPLASSEVWQVTVEPGRVEIADSEPSLKVVAAAETLVLAWPDTTHRGPGVYSLVAGRWKNGWPMWKHATLDWYIARDSEGSWVVLEGDGDTVRYRRQDSPAFSTLPHESTYDWYRIHQHHHHNAQPGDAELTALKAHAAPATLIFAGPATTYPELGVYSLVAGRVILGWPVWKHATIDRYMLRISSGEWAVQDGEDVERPGDVVHYRLPVAAAPLLPHESSAVWQGYAGATWSDRASFKVVTPGSATYYITDTPNGPAGGWEPDATRDAGGRRLSEEGGSGSGDCASRPSVNVTASGGLLVGGEDGFYATVAGAIDTAAGTALLSIRHTGGWSPLAGLVSPAFEGTAAFGVDGTYVRTQAWVQWDGAISIAPGLVSIVGNAAKGSASGARVDVLLVMPTSNLSSLEYSLSFACGLQLGAGTSRSPPVLLIDGLIADGCFSLNVLMSEAWTPLAGTAFEAVVVPQMAGSLAVCNGSWTVDVQVLGPLFPSMSKLGLPSIRLPDLSNVLSVKFPDLAWPALPDVDLLSLLTPGISLPDFRVVRLPSFDLPSLRIAFPHLAWPSVPKLDLPHLYLLLTIAFPDLSWPPMPDLSLDWSWEMPPLQFPQLPKLDLIPGMLTAFDWDVNLRVPTIDMAHPSLPPLAVNASGCMTIGGAGGFNACFVGAFDTGAGSASLAIRHEGGWSPLPPALGDSFATPAFAGLAEININGRYLAVSADAQWTQAVALIPGWVEFTGHPATSAAGVSLSIDMQKETRDASATFVVTGEGGLKLGSGSNPPPTIGFRGRFDSRGTSWLALQTLEAWQPLPVLTVPKLNGTLVFFADGAVQVSVSAEQRRWVIVPDMLEWQDVQVCRHGRVGLWMGRRPRRAPQPRISFSDALLVLIPGSLARHPPRLAAP